MPMLWGDDVIGWANASVVNGDLTVETGFVQRRPKEAVFRDQLSAEIDRLKSFLNLQSDSNAARSSRSRSE
jgi:hypothetical protein